MHTKTKEKDEADKETDTPEGANQWEEETGGELDEDANEWPYGDRGGRTCPYEDWARKSWRHRWRSNWRIAGCVCLHVAGAKSV